MSEKNTETIHLARTSPATARAYKKRGALLPHRTVQHRDLLEVTLSVLRAKLQSNTEPHCTPPPRRTLLTLETLRSTPVCACQLMLVPCAAIHSAVDHQEAACP
eukprot:8618-Heterococcus_DN1.PRE.1